MAESRRFEQFFVIGFAANAANAAGAGGERRRAGPTGTASHQGCWGRAGPRARR